MKRVFAVLVVSLFASAAEGQDMCGAPSTLRGFAVEDSTVGAWADYAGLERNLPSGMGFRVFVAEGPFEGKTRRWLEMWLEKSGRIALRVPVEEENAGMHIKLGHTIFYLPPDQVASKAGGACRGPGDDKAAVPKPFKVIAGTFECQYAKRVYNGNTFEYWMSRDVPPLQLVKALFPGGRGYELVAKGTGAKTVFPERFVAVPFPDAASVSGLLPLDMRQRVEERKTVVSVFDAGVAPLPPLKQWGVDAGTP